MIVVNNCVLGFSFSIDVFKKKGGKEVARFGALQWIAAMGEEMESLRKNQTWGLVKVLKERRIVGCKWVFKKNAGHVHFSEEQMSWLRMIKDHIISSVAIDRESFGYAPFDAEGGIGKMYQLFGDGMDGIIEELNGELVA